MWSATQTEVSEELKECVSRCTMSQAMHAD